jgi:hypothetical protein
MAAAGRIKERIQTMNKTVDNPLFPLIVHLDIGRITT